MDTPHVEQNSKSPQAQTNLDSSIHLDRLDTPAVRLSLTFTDLTPFRTLPNNLMKPFGNLNMRSPSMPILSTQSSPDEPPPDLHSKVQAETTRSSKTNTMNNVARAFGSSRTLHGVLGLREPEPFATPPEMPPDLKERFEVGLQQYKKLYAAGLFAQNTPFCLQTTAAPLLNSKTQLTDILEEKESPVRTAPKQSKIPASGLGLRINVPKWTSDKQAVAAAQRYTGFESDCDAFDDTASEYTDYESEDEDEDEDDSLWRYGSGITLAVSDRSRPGSSASENELSSVPTPLFPLRTSSLIPHSHVSGSYYVIDQQPGHFEDARLRTEKQRQSHVAPNVKPANRKVNRILSSNLPVLGRADLAPVLSLSPNVREQNWGFDYTNGDFMSGNIESKVELSRGYNIMDLEPQTASASIPHINIQAPSPTKSPMSRNRAPSASDPITAGISPKQRARIDDTTGLPVLPLKFEAAWKSKFSGNTHALLTILLTWSSTMWTLYRRLPDPKLFAIHPAFPYSITPPLAKQLVSASFYDTSLEPHREIRFLGPGDVADISYHEVDIFHDPLSPADEYAPSRPPSPMNFIKQTLRLTGSETTNHVRYTSAAQRATTGEGRWCYILLRGHETPAGSTPPHALLAWPMAAVTATSNCLHTIYQEAAPRQAGERIKRFASLQNLGAALKAHARFGFRDTLRAARGGSETVSGDVGVGERWGGATLHRTVLMLEKAGGIPLIEGFRVDVEAFRGWMEACGKGKGKVIMWRERSGS